MHWDRAVKSCVTQGSADLSFTTINWTAVPRSAIYRDIFSALVINGSLQSPTFRSLLISFHFLILDNMISWSLGPVNRQQGLDFTEFPVNHWQTTWRRKDMHCVRIKAVCSDGGGVFYYYYDTTEGAWINVQVQAGWLVKSENNIQTICSHHHVRFLINSRQPLQPQDTPGCCLLIEDNNNIQSFDGLWSFKDTLRFVSLAWTYVNCLHI